MLLKSCQAFFYFREIFLFFRKKERRGVGFLGKLFDVDSLKNDPSIKTEKIKGWDKGDGNWGEDWVQLGGIRRMINFSKSFNN